MGGVTICAGGQKASLPNKKNTFRTGTKVKEKRKTKMKKLFAVMMALCMMLSAVAAFAGEANVTSVNWSDHEADAAKIEGQFTKIADSGFKMFVPAKFKDASANLTQAERDKGMFMVLKSEKDDKAFVNAQIVPKHINEIVGSLQQDGHSVWEMRLNGLIAVQFSVEQDGVTASCFAFGSNTEKTLVFTFAPVNQEPYTSLYKVMASSIQSAQ